MERQKKSMFILLIVIAACIAMYFILTRVNAALEEADEEDTQYALSIDSADVTGFSYIYGDETYTFTLADEEWTCDQMEGEDLDEDSVMAVAQELCAIETEQVIEAPDDLEQYGLENPSNTFTVTYGDETVTILIGDYNDTTGYYYIKNADADDVYVVDSSVITSIETDPSGLVAEEEEESGSTSE
ncbi:DUF4340 domain-containing protein [Eubacterium oxidoreducens]|uniref:DUF4340 domain-containing protein n=1 Tax=Eubacterium oxidoreducens TaxID=1732 RepID=A0A1G6AFY6_EUBOX|nr:DUF4340 domain-containing protein [Eubacterium oxidoreducens]SDB07337.1 protein of unknown function [Eubacterium oxidoreducens]